MGSLLSDEKATKQKNKSKIALYVWFGSISFALLFTILIWILGPNLNHFTATLPLLNNLNHYYWKLPVRDFWAMAIVWIFYLANQFLIWGGYLLGSKKSD